MGAQHGEWASNPYPGPKTEWKVVDFQGRGSGLMVVSEWLESASAASAVHWTAHPSARPHTEDQNARLLFGTDRAFSGENYRGSGYLLPGSTLTATTFATKPGAPRLYYTNGGANQNGWTRGVSSRP